VKTDAHSAHQLLAMHWVVRVIQVSSPVEADVLDDIKIKPAINPTVRASASPRRSTTCAGCLRRFRVVAPPPRLVPQPHAFAVSSVRL
jgi:hypothetical protein